MKRGNRPPLESWQVEDARRLKHLYKEIPHGLSQEAFASRYGIGTQGMVWQYLNGVRPLNIKAAQAFAHGLGIPISAFSQTIADQINAASRIAEPAHHADVLHNPRIQKILSHLAKINDTGLERVEEIAELMEAKHPRES